MSTPKVIYSKRSVVNYTISVASNVKDTGTYQCRANVDTFITSRNVSIDIPSLTSPMDDEPVESLPLLVAVAVVIVLFIVMFIVIMFCLAYRYSNRASNGQYSNMVSRTKIGARLSTTSCSSADFVINKSLVSYHLNMFYLLHPTIVWQ